MDIKQTAEYVRDKLRRIWPGTPGSAGDLWRALGDALTDVARLSLATVLGYLLTVRLLPPPVDLTGALTALLVMQASLRGSFRAGLVRVAAVLTGIIVALGVATFVGLHWWSLAVVVFVALLIARVLGLEGGSLEAAVSGMLILGSSGADVAAWTRLATTLIGTAVGVTLPLLWPRRIRTADLTQGLRRVADRLGQIYTDAAQHLSSHPMTQTAANRWLNMTRQVAPLVQAATTTLDEAAEVRRGNTRQLYRADVVPLLRHGLESLQRSLLASAHLFHVIESEAPAHPTPDDGYGDEVRRALVEVLSDLGHSVESFADLIEAEADGETAAAEAALASALDAFHSSNTTLVGLMKVDPNQTGLWLLRGGIGSAIDQVVAELDLTGYLSHRDRWRASQLGRALPTGSIGPRIRTPWGLLAQRRLQERAAASREAYPTESYLPTSEDTTMLMPALTADPQPRAG